MSYKARFFREEGGEPGGGGGAFDAMFKPVNPTPTPLPPTPPAPPVDPNNPTPPTPPTDPTPVEGLNDDGTLQDGYTRDATGKVVKVEEPPADPNEPTDPVDPADGDEPDEAVKFYEEVEKLTGNKLEVTYPEGVSPISPEGVAHRDTVLREQAMLDMDEFLRKSNPRAYAYMLHTSQGGTDEEFYQNRGPVLPSEEAFEASADIQSGYYKNSLIRKGLDEELAQAQVDKAIKDNTLLAKAKAEYTNDKKAENDALIALQEQERQRAEEIEATTTNMKSTLSEFIKTGLKFAIPEANQADFQKYVLENMQYDPDTKRFMIMQTIDQKNMAIMLNSLFFQYKGADLKQLVEKQAKTKAANTLRLKLDGGKATPGSGSGGDNPPNNGITLGSLFKPVQ